MHHRDIEDTEDAQSRNARRRQNDSMKSRAIQISGLVLSISYAVFIIWIYATETRSLKEVATSAQVSTGTYQIDQAKFDLAHSLFLRDQFRAARDEWQRADPAQGDART